MVYDELANKTTLAAYPGLFPTVLRMTDRAFVYFFSTTDVPHALLIVVRYFLVEIWVRGYCR